MGCRVHQIAENVAEFLLVEVYDSYLLWRLSGEMIRNIRLFELVRVLVLRANAEELKQMLCVIKRTNFTKLPDDWSHRGEGHRLAPDRPRRGENYLFYNLHNERVI